MVNLDTTFGALGDETRRSILSRLRMGEAGLSELAEPFDMSQTAVSKHVRILSDAGLVHVEKRGRTRYCRLEASALESAVEWLNGYQGFWDDQAVSLAEHLNVSQDNDT